MEWWSHIQERAGWRDLVDVGVLTVVAFHLYRRLRGTVAIHVVGGLIAIALGSIVAQLLGLVLTAYVVKAVAAVVTLVIIVVFQAEIRRALGHISPVRWWRRRRFEGAIERSHSLELARSLHALARAGIGALVVVPGVDEICEHVSGGTDIGGSLSAELLISIFHTGSPLHDGAVVVRHGSVDRACVLLPLSRRVDLPAEWGTRHRAAVGLTDLTDATVLVVSEERNDVTVFKRSSHVRAPESDDVLADVLAGMISEKDGGDEVQRYPRRLGLWRGLVAFAGIFAMVSLGWFVLVGSQPAVVTVEASIELRNLPEGFSAEILQPRKGLVQLQLRGPRRLLSTGTTDVSAWVDMTGLGPGRYQRRIQTSTPPAVHADQVIPPTAFVVLRRERNR